MMNRSRPFLRRINPGPDDFQNEEVVFRDQRCINNLAFQAGIALLNKRSLDELGGYGRESKFLELVHVATGSVPASHHSFHQFHGRDVDHTFAGLLEAGKGVITIADHAAHERRSELHHQVPRHGHNVCPPGANGGEQHDWAGFEQPINLG